MKRSNVALWLAQEIADQHKWIEDHGGSRAGYVDRYGSKDDSDHYGDGGEAIYDADQAQLAYLCYRYKAVTR